MAKSCQCCGEPIASIKQALSVVGGLSAPSKMPSFGYSIPANRCPLGSKLRKVPGSICSKCYALKGRYLFKNVRDALERRFESLTDPRWVDAMVYLINTRKLRHFRWHDAGDLQGVWHLANIAKVAALTPDCRHWLPTRELRTVGEYLEEHERPKNLNIRLSAMAFDKRAPEGFARKRGLTVSGASANGSHNCPAPTQGNSCGDCRACWDVDTFSISYKQH